MVNTKVTPKKPKEICPVCFKEVEGKDAWTAHVIKCAGVMKNNDPRRIMTGGHFST